MDFGCHSREQVANDKYGYAIENCAHGWPFVYLDRSVCTLQGVPTAPPQTLRSGESFDDFATRTAPELPPFRLNLKLDYTPVSHGQYDGDGAFRVPDWPILEPYWTNRSIWPHSDTGCCFRFRFLGLVLNLIFLGLTILLVGSLVQRWLRRRKRGVRISLRATMVLIALFAIFLSWGPAEFREHKQRKQQLQTLFLPRPHPTLLRIDGHYNSSGYVVYRNRFPRLISLVLNNGHLPLLDPSFYLKWDETNLVDRGKTWIRVLYKPSDKSLSLRRTPPLSEYGPYLKKNRISATVTLPFFDADGLRMLDDLGPTSIEGLKIRFHQPYGNLIAPRSSSQKDRQLVEATCAHEFQKDLKAYGDQFENLSQLKRLIVDLTLCPDQAAFLECFCGLESLEKVGVSGLDQDGADFLLMTKDKWPKNVRLTQPHLKQESTLELLKKRFLVSAFEDP